MTASQKIVLDQMVLPAAENVKRCDVRPAAKLKANCDVLSVIECFETDGGVNIRFDRLI
jgi:hypothetical protein